MKKITALLLVLTLVFAFASCAGEKAPISQPEQDAPVVTQAETTKPYVAEATTYFPSYNADPYDTLYDYVKENGSSSDDGYMFIVPVDEFTYAIGANYDGTIDFMVLSDSSDSDLESITTLTLTEGALYQDVYILLTLSTTEIFAMAEINPSLVSSTYVPLSSFYCDATSDDLSDSTQDLLESSLKLLIPAMEVFLEDAGLTLDDFGFTNF